MNIQFPGTGAEDRQRVEQRIADLSSDTADQFYQAAINGKQLQFYVIKNWHNNSALRVAFQALLEKTPSFNPDRHVCAIEYIVELSNRVHGEGVQPGEDWKRNIRMLDDMVGYPLVDTESLIKGLTIMCGGCDYTRYFAKKEELEELGCPSCNAPYKFTKSLDEHWDDGFAKV